MALNYSQITFELRIPDLSKLENFCSPEVIIQKIPWRILVGKEQHGTKQWLAIYLHCLKKDKTADWSYAAVSSFKLKSFRDGKAVQRHVQPFIFDRSELGFGTGSFIGWNDLINHKNGFVKDDTIKMDITIEVADPSDKTKSELIIENAHVSSSTHKFRLNVTNIQNLLAVRSQLFSMQKQPWYFTVCRDHSSNLVVRLHSSGELSCRKRMLVRLMSTQKIKKSVHQIKSEDVQPGGIISTTKLIPLDDLLKPKNQFLKNNTVSIEVEITTESTVSNYKYLEVAKSNVLKAEEAVLRMECAICLDRIEQQEVSSILCGHLFCSKCINHTLKEYKVCPLCKTPVNSSQLRRIYLPL